MNKKILRVVIFFLVVFVLAASCFLSKKKEEKVKIVTSATMRGIEAGVDTINGVKLALKEADYMAGKYKVELVVEDDGDEDGTLLEDAERAIAERAASDEDVMIYLGPIDSGAAKISIPITNKAGLPQISPTNTWPGLTQAGFAPGEPGIFYPTGVRTYFRVCPTDAVQGPAGAIWAKEMGLENIFIFDDGTLYGLGITNIFKEKAIALDLNVLGHETLDTESRDLGSKLNEMKDLDLDLIYFGGIPSTGLISLIKAVKSSDLNMKFMGTDGILDQFVLDQTGEASEGMYLTTIGLPISELEGEGRVFYENYINEYGIEPNTYSAFAYEATRASLLAISRMNKKDRTEVLENLTELKGFPSIFNEWSFDSKGDTSLVLVSGSVVRDGNFEYEKTLSSRYR